MLTRDALLAETSRVLVAARPAEADSFLREIERALGGGSHESARRLLERLAPDLRAAYPSAPERLLFPLELALLERRQGNMGVLRLAGARPHGWNSWCVGAELAERRDDADADLFIAVREDWKEPFLAIERKSEVPAYGPPPDVLVLPEHRSVFVGLGLEVSVYGGTPTVRRMQFDDLFWSFARWKDLVLVQAETDLYACAPDGSIVWRRFIDPPHSIRVEGDVVVIEEFGGVCHRLRAGDGTPVPT